jgi:hypothetical protein
MLSFMTFQVKFVHEPFLTKSTIIWIFANMRIAMSQEAVLPCETFSTYITIVVSRCASITSFSNLQLNYEYLFLET